MRINDQIQNRLTVVKAIRRYGPIARSDLIGATGLSASMITQITRELIERGLVVEKKQEAKGAPGRTGRRRVDLAINAKGGIVLGASVGGPSGLTISFVNLAGANLYSLDRPWKRPPSLTAFAHGMAAALDEEILRSPFAKEQLSRVGLALPAIVDNQSGVVHWMTTFKYDPVPFAAIIADRLGIPLTIESDMVCMARSEHWFGRARDLENFTLIEVGGMVGSSEYKSGLPQLGSNGLNLDIGHTKVALSGTSVPCHCGGDNCLTAFSSMFGLVHRMGWSKVSTLRSLNELDQLFLRFLDEVDHGDPIACSFLEDAAFHLSMAIANHLNWHDPGDVIILVRNAQFLNLLKGKVLDLIKGKCLPGALDRTSITFALSNQDWRWKGTAALALEKLYIGDVSFNHHGQPASKTIA